MRIPGAVKAGTLAALGLLASAAVWAQVPGEKAVDGMVVRIGIAPRDQVLALPVGHPERTMHAGQRGSDHLVVSIADERTGARIDEARITASISRDGMEESRRKLERMPAEGATSYGGYFDLDTRGTYFIHLDITTPERPARAVAEFTYQRP